MTVSFFCKGEPFAIIAHRGSSHSAPENTMFAFEQAWLDGAQFIELDICITQDDELVCIHDERLERTTTGKGLCAEQLAADLLQLDAGSWFSSKFKDAKIPTLAEIFSWARQKSLILNVEIKPEAFTSSKSEPLIHKLAGLIETHEMREQVLLSSFSVPALRASFTVMPDVSRALLLERQPAMLQDLQDLITQTAAKGIHIDRKAVQQNFVNFCHRLGLWVAVYTVDDPHEAAALHKQRVNAIFTNRPKQMLEQFASK